MSVLSVTRYGVMKTGKAKEPLKEGFSTGACAAAAAKAAATLAADPFVPGINRVTIPFPNGARHSFTVSRWGRSGDIEAWACVVKHAGDDPDITDGAEIVSRVKIISSDAAGKSIMILGGEGVGRVTKPGLAIPPGSPAINPVPRKMIRQAVAEAIDRPGFEAEVTVSVPKGEELAARTLNHRLGIVGGISILGTTGIVKPISAEAWCATIRCSMDVCLAAGLDQVVLATGRTSERAAQHLFDLPEEAYVSMGDYIIFSLKEASKRPFRQVHLASQWSKLIKMAMGWEQTNVKHGVLNTREALAFLTSLVPDVSFEPISSANTVREIFILMKDLGLERGKVTGAVCYEAFRRLKPVLLSDQDLMIHLVSYSGKVVESFPNRN
jgi:cobalt-precorrin-5B (C1)-methyltransferase